MRKTRSDKGKKRSSTVSRVAKGALAAGAIVGAGALAAKGMRRGGGMKALPKRNTMRSAAPRGSRVASAVGSAVGGVKKAASGVKKQVGFRVGRASAIGKAAGGAAQRGYGKARTAVSNRATQFKNRKKPRLGGA